MGPSLDRALEVLLDDALAHVVEMVLLARDGAYEAASSGGSVTFRRDGTIERVHGRNPLERDDPAAFSPLDAELADVRPARNVFPHAFERIAQLFDDPRAPDLAVVHTPAHNWEERGGHRGEHGSLGLVQSRAPLILAGAGVRRAGTIARHARMIDIAPTMAALLGLPRAPGLLSAQDGVPLDDLLDPADPPETVVGLLCDGTNANVLYAMAGAGECPNVARLMAAGTTLGHGCIASFPSVTLPNHTTALTGVHPGRHGILNNFYYDREASRQIVTNAPGLWHLARHEIRADVETIFEAVARAAPGFTAAINEPADRGATYATFDLLRSGEVSFGEGILPDPTDDPDATQGFVDKRDYRWASAADRLALQQVSQVASGAAGSPRPRLLWVNLILNDAANHTGGPYSDIGYAGVRDTDARIGHILDAVDFDAGRTAVVLLADHGMEESDPDCKGDWDAALARAGVRFRDEAQGFIYLDP